jgi:hypothetical protein
MPRGGVVGRAAGDGRAGVREGAVEVPGDRLGDAVGDTDGSPDEVGPGTGAEALDAGDGPLESDGTAATPLPHPATSIVRPASVARPRHAGRHHGSAGLGTVTPGTDRGATAARAPGRRHRSVHPEVALG